MKELLIAVLPWGIIGITLVVLGYKNKGKLQDVWAGISGKIHPTQQAMNPITPIVTETLSTAPEVIVSPAPVGAVPAPMPIAPQPVAYNGVGEPPSQEAWAAWRSTLNPLLRANYPEIYHAIETLASIDTVPVAFPASWDLTPKRMIVALAAGQVYRCGFTWAGDAVHAIDMVPGPGDPAGSSGHYGISIVTPAGRLAYGSAAPHRSFPFGSGAAAPAWMPKMVTGDCYVEVSCDVTSNAWLIFR
jgi:hypothetical protein